LFFFFVFYSRLNARDDITVFGSKEKRAAVRSTIFFLVRLVSVMRMYIHTCTGVIQDWTPNRMPSGDGGVERAVRHFRVHHNALGLGFYSSDNGLQRCATRLGNCMQSSFRAGRSDSLSSCIAYISTFNLPSYSRAAETRPSYTRVPFSLHGETTATATSDSQTLNLYLAFANTHIVRLIN
jgi:hypothetical protein